jgi:hypothetical protein
MNAILDSISNTYEGPLKNREGHNFPALYIPKSHILEKYRNKCKYVIGIYNSKSIQHELLHAKYYIDNAYAQKINQEWFSLAEGTRNYLTQFLKRLGYSDKVIIDEYQAYRYTEASNFFGIKLN